MSASPFASIIDVLKSSLGDQAASAIVTREAQAAGLTAVRTDKEALELLTRIERLGGAAGLAARLAIGRISRGVPVWGLSNSTSSTSGSSSIARPRSDRPTAFTPAHIASLLSRAIGDEKAADAVQKAMTELRLSGPVLSKDDAVRLLDNLVTKGGGVGTVARFAKVRFMLDH